MTPRSSRLHPLRWFLVLVALAALGACGPGTGPDGGSADADAGQEGLAAGEVAVPTLPPIAERRPGQFTPEGCAATSAGADCTVEAADIDATQRGAVEEDWRVLAGFSGTRWADTTGGPLTVLEDTVTVGPGPTWVALGLVRNETAQPVADVVVTAHLLDAAGAEVAVAEATVALPVLRPGEPAPFSVSAEVALGGVAAVAWSTAGATPEALPGRDLELAVFWERPSTEPASADTYLYQDPVDGPRRFVAFGGATAVGAEPVDGLVVLAAWIDDGGRVVAVTEGLVSAPTVAPGTAADFVVVADGPTFGDVDAARLLLWGSGT